MATAKVFLSLGSNIERETHLLLGLKMLEEHLLAIHCSPIFESVSSDGIAPPFYNVVITGETYLSLKDLIFWLKEIEYLHGRCLQTKQAKVPLDIDVLFFNYLNGVYESIELPRPEIVEHAYILYPLYLLAPEKIHPKTRTSISSIWKNSKVSPPLKLITHALSHETTLPLFADAPLHHLPCIDEAANRNVPNSLPNISC